MRYAYMYVHIFPWTAAVDCPEISSNIVQEEINWCMEVGKGISWYTLSYSIAVNMVTSLSVGSGRKIGAKNSKLVKFLGAV